LKSIDCADHVSPCSFYLSKKIPIQGVAYQVGTCRFGTDPKTSVLDVNCKTHDVDNLCLVDGRFFHSRAAENRSLSIMVSVLQVGDYLVERLK
jgi:choline dehydrogenase-like flavoprotein